MSSVCQAEPGCFEKHLTDAIAINEARAPLYSAMSDGASEKISRTLISHEKLALPAARLFQDRAQRFQDAGVAVMCDEFVPMTLAPAFPADGKPLPPPAQPFRARPIDPLIGRLLEAQTLQGADGVKRVAQDEIDELKAQQPSYHCMRRHFLESIVRAAELSPIHAEEAEAAGLGSPERISSDFILIQILGLQSYAKLDASAAPLQERGIPIICQDVPPIDQFPLQANR